MKKICLNTNKEYTGFYINEDKFIFLNKNGVDEYDNKLNYIKTIYLDDEYNSISYNDKLYLSKDNKLYVKEENINLVKKVENNINSLNFYQSKLVVCNNNIYILKDNIEQFLDSNVINSLLKNDINNKIYCATHINNNVYVIYSNNKKVYISSIYNYRIIANKYFLGKNIEVYNTYYYQNKLYILVKSNNKMYLYIILEYKHYNNCLELIKCLCSCNYNDIPTSIAMIEKSIAKILDAEARKIQKIISITCNVDELLKVNDSVNEMVKKITLLEQALCSKLEIYEKIIRENSH